MPDRDGESPGALRECSRAEARALRARFEANRTMGRHLWERGLRNEEILIEFLREHLPARFGVSRGEIMDSKGGVARQIDVVLYDAHFSPVFIRTDSSRVFASECVYGVIEVKANLHTAELDRALAVLSSVKELDRSAVVEMHGGHRQYHGPKGNPPPFAAVFALESVNLRNTLMPELELRLANLPGDRWLDCVCVLGESLVYQFQHLRTRDGRELVRPTVLCEGAQPGFYESKEDSLFLFYLFLLHQLNARELFPPNLLAYAGALPVGPPTVSDRAPRARFPRRG